MFIITGHMRSGTTLLRELCGGHPDVFITAEQANFQHLGKVFNLYAKFLFRHSCIRLLGTKVFSSQFSWNGKRIFMILRYLYSLRRVVGQGPVTSVAVEQALRRLVPQAREIGDKHPMYMMRLPDLVLEENLKIVVIYRDCRDVVSSVMQKARTDWKNKRWVGNIDTPEKIARRWVDSCLLIERYADRLHVMRYEDLVTSPAQYLHRLGEYLEVDPDGFPDLNIRTNSIGKYRSGLTDRDLAHVMTIAGPTMTRFGYE